MMGAARIRARLWRFGMTLFFAQSFATTSIGADGYSYDIQSNGRTTFQLAFLPDKVLIKGSSLVVIGGCQNQGVVVPKNGGEAHMDGEMIGIRNAVTATHFSEGPLHRIRIVIKSQANTGYHDSFVYEMSLRFKANSCRMISYALGVNAQESDTPGAIVKMLDGTSAASCAQYPLSAFEEDRSCKH